MCNMCALTEGRRGGGVSLVEIPLYIPRYLLYIGEGAGGRRVKAHPEIYRYILYRRKLETFNMLLY